MYKYMYKMTLINKTIDIPNMIYGTIFFHSFIAQYAILHYPSLITGQGEAIFGTKLCIPSLSH